MKQMHTSVQFHLDALQHHGIRGSISLANGDCMCAQIVAVSNDITFNSGAFGTKEDAVFRAATEHALEEKLPLIYLAANAGARVGLAQEVKQCLQVTPVLHVRNAGV